MERNAHPDYPKDGEGGTGLTTRERALWLAGAALLLVSLLAGVAVFGGGDEAEGGGRFLSADGLVTEVTAGSVRMHLSHQVDGHEELDFTVRPNHRAEVDVPHLREHLADGVPTRIYYRREGDNYIARDSADVPLQ